jgi:hypothetical protein
VIEHGALLGLILGIGSVAALLIAKTSQRRALAVTAGLLGFGYTTLLYPQLSNSCRSSNEVNARATIVTLVTAQKEFRDKDLDGNGLKDYWRADLAGLYVVNECKLIEISLAGADDRPKTDIQKYADRSPKAGYWYRSLRFADEKDPDPARWAACAYPDSPSAGPYTYLITHDGKLYRRKGLHRDLDVVPTPEQLARDWTRPD